MEAQEGPGAAAADPAEAAGQEAAAEGGQHGAVRHRGQAAGKDGAGELYFHLWQNGTDVYDNQSGNILAVYSPVLAQELERQGVKLEKSIRELCEKTDRERAEAGIDVNENGRESLGPEVRICYQRFLYSRN